MEPVRYDVIVIGAGLAGTCCALRLSEEGQRVLVVAKGVGAIQLAGGTVDVLGFAPKRVDDPSRALAELVAERPTHPYARTTIEGIRRAIEWFKGVAEPFGYAGDLRANLLLPTAVGALKPTALAPAGMLHGDVRGGGSFAIVGLPALKDFYPSYLASNLGHDADVSARSLEVRVRVAEADVTPLSFARLFDDPEFRKAVIADLQPALEPDDAVGFPAVLGLDDHPTVWQELQDSLGGRVFEIPTLPPSVPGIRLFRTLKGALRQRGGRLVLGSTAVGAQTTGGRVSGIVLESAARPIVQRAQHFVLAAGGFASGGLELDSRWTARETALGLPVTGVPDPGAERFRPGYFDDHPMARAGVAVDRELRPVDGGGDRLYENVLVAGATLAGAEPWREKSGDGLSLSTGYRAAELVLEAPTAAGSPAGAVGS